VIELVLQVDGVEVFTTWTFEVGASSQVCCEDMALAACAQDLGCVLHGGLSLSSIEVVHFVGGCFIWAKMPLM